MQASSVTGNHVASEAEETTTRLELVRPAQSKYEWEWDDVVGEELLDVTASSR